MVFTKLRLFSLLTLTTCLLVFSASVAFAQDTTNQAGSRTVASGQKMKIKGVVTRRDSDTFTVRDMNGVDTVVRLDNGTSVKTKGGFLRGGTNYAQTNILRGLNVEVEGRGTGSGELAAEKIRFNESDMRTARAVESRAAPLEERASNTETKLTQVEANAQRYVLEVSGYTDTTGSIQLNRMLSQKRADAVIRYLVENHNIPLRRIVTPYGYGESHPVAENTSRDGRAQNRRVAIKLLVNKGLTAPAPSMNKSS